MRTIGLIGGMSWESTAVYYEQLNRKINQRLGGLHSAKIIVYSVDFHQIEQFQRLNQWDQAAEILIDAARALEKAGADVIGLCTNTMHKVADAIETNLNIPFLHIADATVQALQKQNIKQAGLLATAFTMEQDFYVEKFKQRGIQLITPSSASRARVHQIIYEELCHGVVKHESKIHYLNIMDDLKQQGAEAIILGCTEIGLLIKQPDVEMLVLDTTLLHVDLLIELALETDTDKPSNKD